MQNRILMTLAFLAMCLPLTAAEVEENETIQKSYPLSGAAPKKVIVDNVDGSIRVTGLRRQRSPPGGPQASAAPNSEQAAEEARRDVKLDIYPGRQHCPLLRGWAVPLPKWRRSHRSRSGL